MRKFIRKIKVGSVVYDVYEQENLSYQFSYFGLCDKAANEIIIAQNIDKFRKDKTLIHEILHATFYESGLHQDFDEDKEEILVERLSSVLHQVLVDNDFSFLEKPRVKEKEYEN